MQLFLHTKRTIAANTKEMSPLLSQLTNTPGSLSYSTTAVRFPWFHLLSH
uniref:Uncharacterized protein n=1 Tax=Anguilla anguilla TaxID=7936 RepID=A0A0E9XAR2_ANGAN